MQDIFLLQFPKNAETFWSFDFNLTIRKKIQ